MSIDVNQFVKYILRPALKNVGLYSKKAEIILLGSAAAESEMGYYIHQINGPALGIYQMEPKTHDDIWKNFINYREKLKNKILFEFNFNHQPMSYELIGNLGYATVMARLHYLRIEEELPDPEDVKAMAQYYKKYYNTAKGAAKLNKFINCFEKYVKGKLYGL